jgi:hypothetical protein
VSEAFHPPTLLTPSGTRAVAAVMVRAADPAVPPIVATTLVDMVDQLTATVLLGAGLSPAEALSVLGYLWATR